MFADQHTSLFILPFAALLMLSTTEFATADSEIFEPGIDPNVGAVVTAFLSFDPQNPSDSFDILTGWKAAVDEFAQVGFDEITFAVYRQVQNGNLSGGPAMETVEASVQYAISQGLSVTILPLFETENGWRGIYDPSGQARNRFQEQYTQFIADLAQIPGIDRFNIGSELNQMVENPANMPFFLNLISTVETSLALVGNQLCQIGYAANFDAFDLPQHSMLLTSPGIDFMGVSAYQSIIAPSQAQLVSGTGPVADNVFDVMVERWNAELEDLISFSIANDLPILIQEFGAVQRNYSSVAPFAVDPGAFVSPSLPDRFADDPLEQRAAVESLIVALDGRADVFESVTFWTWEHQASRGRRTFDQLGTTGVIERFALWPTDGGGGQFLTEFVATREDPIRLVERELIVEGTDGDDLIAVSESDSEIFITLNEQVRSFDLNQVDSITVRGNDGMDFIRRLGQSSVTTTLDGGNGNDVLQGGNGNDILQGGSGDDELFGGAGDDLMAGGSGDDQLEGNSGDDVLRGDQGMDRLFGQDGDDELLGRNGDDFLHGGNGADRLFGDGGNDTLSGANDDDLIRGGNGEDILFGGNGNDHLEGQADDDQLFGGAGDDLVNGQLGDDYLHGGSGNDQLIGLAGNDTILGSTGNDEIFGGSGDDVLFGGDGDDEINGQTGDDRLDGGNGDDLLFGAFGDDLQFGGRGDDLIIGGTGRDFLIGGFGADTLNGQADSDLLVGASISVGFDLPVLEDLFFVWLTDANYLDRVNGIRGDLDAIRLPDIDADLLVGNGELDYFRGESEESVDLMTDEVRDE